MRSRYIRIAALLSIRSDGRWPAVVQGRENGAVAQTRNLEDAALALRRRAGEDPEDPVRRSDLGEALAALPRSRREAREILEDLAKRDLVTSARAYAALAKLRQAAGDGAGSLAALALCRKTGRKGRGLSRVRLSAHRRATRSDSAGRRGAWRAAA